MCICLFGADLLPAADLAFLLCFNRDEFSNRPTQPTHFWHDLPHILAGRDLARGGTWLGMTPTGRIAFLTNIRACDSNPGLVLAMEDKRSRGELITNFLSCNLTPLEYCQQLNLSDYYGFNLVCADLATGSVAYTNNNSSVCPADTKQHSNGSAVPAQAQHPSGPGTPQGAVDPSGLDPNQVPVELQPGQVYGVSNGLLNEWPKVESGVQVLTDLLHQAQQAGLPKHTLPWDAMFTTLLGDMGRDESRRPVNPSTGQPLPEHQLAADKHLDYVASSRFLPPLPSKFGPYGTRTQTVLAVWKDGTVEVRERDLELDSIPNSSAPQTAAQSSTGGAEQTLVHSYPHWGQTQVDAGVPYSKEVLAYEALEVAQQGLPLAGAWRTTRHTFVMQHDQHV